MGSLAAVLIVIAVWSVIVLRQINWLSDSAAGLAMCLVCGAGFVGCLLFDISMIAAFFSLSAMAFLSALLWTFGYLR